MSNAAPPAWVLALPLGSGQWRYLVKAWGYGPFRNAKPDAPPLPEAARAKACNATIAARSGQPKSTAAKQALALAGAGWVRRDADGYLTLASWRAPHVFTLDAAVEAGLVVREQDGVLSWTHPASGATQPTDGVPHTTDGSTRSRGAPNPPVVHPQPATGATHTTDGSQSCLSSLSSFGHEVEARDPHDPGGWVAVDCEVCAGKGDMFVCPKCGTDGAVMVRVDAYSPRLQAREPWPARVRKASEDQRKRETHEAIQAQQLDLEARRTETRARMEAQQAAEFAATDETSAQLEAIRAVSPEWGRCLMWPKWESSAIAATIELNLDAAAVTWLLEHHDSTGRELHESGTLRETEVAGRPTRRELWSRWSTHRAWVQEALLERERATRPAQPDWRTRPRLGGQKAWDEL